MHIYSRRLVSGAGAGAVRGVSRRLLSTIPAVMYIPGSMPDKTLYIIDGTSLLFTTWFAKEHSQSKTILTTRNGVDCRAIAHMVGRLCYFMGTVRPKYVALVFDSKNVIKRDIYPEYKATRKGKDPALLAQLSLAQSFFEGLGFPCFSAPRHEADDVMATIGRYVATRGLVDVVVHVSPDKDMHQLVCSAPQPVASPSTGDESLQTKTQTVVMPKILTSPAALLEHDIQKMYGGLTPSQLCDFYALVGDSSDNIPGLRGVGPTIGAALIRRYSDVETLFETMTVEGLDETLLNSRRSGKALLERLHTTGLERLLLFRRLVQLQDNIECVGERLAAAEASSQEQGQLEPALSCFQLRRLLGTALAELRSNDGAVRVSYLHGFPPVGSPITADGDVIDMYSAPLTGSYRFLNRFAEQPL